MDEKLLKAFQDHQYNKWLGEHYPEAQMLGFDVYPDGSFDIEKALKSLKDKFGEEAVKTFYQEYFERGQFDYERATISIKAVVFSSIFDRTVYPCDLEVCQ